MIKHRDTISALFWFIIGLGFSIWTLMSYQIGGLLKPQPGFFPLALGIFLMILSLILFFGRMRKTPDIGLKVDNNNGFAQWKNVAFTALVLFIAAIMLERVGYLITFFLMIVFLVKGGGQRTWATILLTGLFTTAGVYIVFILILKQPLPGGLIGG